MRALRLPAGLASTLPAETCAPACNGGVYGPSGGVGCVVGAGGCGAVVSVAVLITLDRKICCDARIVLGAVASAPVRAFKAEEYLQGKELSEENTAEAAEIALAGAKPLAKNAYKVEIAKTLVKRAVTAAVLKC